MARRRRQTSPVQWQETDFSRPAAVGMLIAVGYGRLSNKELEAGYSIEIQIDDTYARNEKEPTWDFRGFYIDDGRSAYAENALKRPCFNCMLRDAAAGKFQVICFHRVSRLARSTEIALRVTRQLHEMGIKVIFIREDIDFSTPEGRMKFTRSAVAAEEHSVGISSDVKNSVHYKWSQREVWGGRPPFGYELCDDGCPYDENHPYWHVDDVKGPAVQTMFELYDSGIHSLADIARRLHREGFRTNGNSSRPEGNPFSSEAVRAILRNKKFMGMVANSSSATDESDESSDLSVAPPAVVDIQGLHTPIVSREIFKSVNERLNANRHENAGRKPSEPQMLERIVHCYICDARYYVMKQGGRYTLRMKNRDGECVCSRKSTSVKFVERDVDLFLRDFELEDNWQVSVAEALRDEPDFRQVEEKRQGLLEDRRRLNTQFRVDRFMTETEYTAQMTEILNDLASLESPTKEQVTKATEFLGSFTDAWASGNASEKNEMLHRMLDRIYFDPETRRLHSIVPSKHFAIAFRSMAERGDITLGPLSEEDLEKCRKSRALWGKTAQFTTSALKIVFLHHLSLENLADRIATKRVKSLMTRAALAERLDVSTYSIASLEHGATPGIEFHERIAAWLADPLPEWSKLLEEENIGQRIRDQRQAWGLSQVELGDSIGVLPAAISAFERGATPSMQTIAKIATWLAEKPTVRVANQSINADFGKGIREKRLKIAMSQTALGKHLGVDKKAIRHWESGVNSPSKRYAKMLDNWLGEPADGILAQRIRDKRKSLFMTQKDVATALGVSLITIKGWENRRAFPSPNNLSRVITWLSRGHLHRKPEKQPEFAIFVLPMKEKRESLGIGTLTLALHLGVGKNRVREWETGRSIPSEAGCRKIGNWLEAA